MNMMQVVLQKVSYRSKGIQKQESYLSSELKRKNIMLEEDSFDLMEVLRKSLEIAE